MFYEYIGLACPNAPVDPQGRKSICHHTLSLSVSAGCDGKRKACPVGGCKGKLTRIISSSVQVIIRGKTGIDQSHGKSYMAKVNGKDIKFTFADHEHTKPENMRNLAGLAGGDRIGADGLGKAYWSEEHKQMVVTVKSNVADPLGKIKRAADEVREERKIGEPYRIRPGAKRKVNWQKHAHNNVFTNGQPR